MMKPVHLARSYSGFIFRTEPGVNGKYSIAGKIFEGVKDNPLTKEGSSKDAESFCKPRGWKFAVPSEFL